MSQCFRMASLAAKKSDSSLGAHIRCISGRADKAKGIKAGAHKLAKLYYSMCKHGWEYHRKGASDYEREYNERRLQNLKRSARSLGYDLIEKKEAA